MSLAYSTKGLVEVTTLLSANLWRSRHVAISVPNPFNTSTLCYRFPIATSVWYLRIEATVTTTFLKNVLVEDGFSIQHSTRPQTKLSLTLELCSIIMRITQFELWYGFLKQY